MSSLFYMIGLASSYCFSIELTIGSLVLRYLNFGMGEDCGFGGKFQNILSPDIPSSVL